MKILVYYVCFGIKYRDVLNRSLYSLFEVGKYQGDVCVITHFDKDISYPDKVRLIKVKPDQDNITFYRNSKPKIIDYVDLKDYDFILYLDCDVLVNTDRLMSLIEKWYMQKDNIFIQKDIIPIWRNKPYCGSEVVPVEERKKNGHLAFNAGIIGARPENFKKLCTLWNEKNKEYNFTKDDQGNLVFVILRNFLSVIKYADDVTITNRKNDEHRTETLLHFLMKSERALYSYFDKYIRKK